MLGGGGGGVRGGGAGWWWGNHRVPELLGQVSGVRFGARTGAADPLVPVPPAGRGISPARRLEALHCLHLAGGGGGEGRTRSRLGAFLRTF